VATVSFLAQTVRPILDRHSEPVVITELDALTLAPRRSAATEDRLQIVPARLVGGDHG